MPILLSSKDSSDMLLSIPLHCYLPIGKLFCVDYCNSLLLDVLVSSLAQGRANARLALGIVKLGIGARSKKSKC